MRFVIALASFLIFAVVSMIFFLSEPPYQRRMLFFELLNDRPLTKKKDFVFLPYGYAVDPKNNQTTFSCDLFSSIGGNRESSYASDAERMRRYKNLVKVYLNKLKTGPNIGDYLLTGTSNKQIYYSKEEINCVEAYVTYLDAPNWQPPSPTGIRFRDDRGLWGGKAPKVETFDCRKHKQLTAEIVKKGGLRVLEPIKNHYLHDEDLKLKKLMDQHEVNLKKNLIHHPKDPAAIAANQIDDNRRAQHECTKEILKFYGLVE